MRHSIAAGIALAFFAGAAHAASFTVIDVVGGQATGISHNGRIVGGIAGASAWRWVKDRAPMALDGFTSTNGMSPWGQPLAGSATSAGNQVAALAYSNTNLVGPVVIGGYPGGVGFDNVLSSAYGVSNTGIAVGLAYDASSNAIAFRWSADAGMTRLPVNRPANYSRANGISADGSTAFGWNDQDDGGRTGVIWRNGVVTDLVGPGGELPGEALAANSTGSVVVGSSLTNPVTGASEAWRWTEAGGVQPIGFIGDFGTAFAFGTSEDGNVVVGASGFGFQRDAVVWTPSSGMQLLRDYAAAHGLTIPADWTLSSAGAVSADGMTITGWGRDPDFALKSFIVDLHPAAATEAKVEAHGTINWNDLSTGPFAGVAVGTPVTMTFRITAVDPAELEPGQATRYRILLDTFSMTAGAATQTLVATAFGPGLIISNDYPKSDGIHLMSSPTATPNQSLEFELFNPGGDLFDSDDLDRINRTFGPELFEKIAWSIEGNGGAEGMYLDLQSVRIEDFHDRIFANGFDAATP